MNRKGFVGVLGALLASTAAFGHATTKRLWKPPCDHKPWNPRTDGGEFTSFEFTYRDYGGGSRLIIQACSKCGLLYVASINNEDPVPTDQLISGTDVKATAIEAIVSNNVRPSVR